MAPELWDVGRAQPHIFSCPHSQPHITLLTFSLLQPPPDQRTPVLPCSYSVLLHFALFVSHLLIFAHFCAIPALLYLIFVPFLPISHFPHFPHSCLFLLHFIPFMQNLPILLFCPILLSYPIPVPFYSFLPYFVVLSHSCLTLTLFA